MNEVFVDTSALYALPVEGDDNHQWELGTAPSLRSSGASLVTSSFVVLATVALLQTRIGVAAVRVFHRDVLRLLGVVLVDEGQLHRALAALLASSHPGVTRTDWSSFTMMRERGIGRVLAFDEDFARQGFELVPAGVRPAA